MFRKRWTRRALAGLLTGLLLLVATFFFHRYLTRRASQQKYETIVAHLNATDPRWRYADVDVDSGQLPDDQNGALLIPIYKAARVSRRVGDDRRLSSNRTSNVPPNQLYDDEAYDAIDEIVTDDRAALAVALRFADYPRGLRRYALTPNPFGIKLPELDETRGLVRLLDLAAERYARDGRGTAALGCVRPMVHATRSLDGEPFLMSALARVAGLRMAANRVERTLALSEPHGRLAEVQELLLREADADLFWYALRGERAVLDVTFTSLRDGTLPPDDVVGDGTSRAKDAFRTRIAVWRYRPRAAGDHATWLDITTKMCEARTLPEHRQRAAVQAAGDQVRQFQRSSTEALLSRLFVPRIARWHETSLRAKAQLRCAAAALAVERYRLATGSWPATLDAIPKDILPVFPLDPFNGKPLKYARRPDGVTVYSVGVDESDDGGAYRPSAPASEPGQDIVFRLYDPARRGQPAEPERSGLDRRWFDRDEPVRNADDPPVEDGPDPRELDGVP
jgi:hypothetical protein